jgi:hypothetical protein
MNSMYGKASFVCFLAFLFGVWMHNVGAMAGWFVAFITTMKLWAHTHVSHKLPTQAQDALRKVATVETNTKGSA